MLSTFFLFLGVDVISKEHAINEQIREKEVRLIGDNGEQLGIVSSKQALDMAGEKNLDLVMIAPGATPPVCKIMDYGKFRFEAAKKEKEQRKNQKVVNIKEVRLSPSIEEHDIEIKANNARKFLLAEDKVKVTVRFRGREAEYSHLGTKILDLFLTKLEGVCIVEKPAKLEGKNMTMILAPKRA